MNPASPAASALPGRISLPGLELGWRKIRPHGQLFPGPTPSSFPWVSLSPLPCRGRMQPLHPVPKPLNTSRPGKAQTCQLTFQPGGLMSAPLLLLSLVSPLLWGPLRTTNPILFSIPLRGLQTMILSLHPTASANTATTPLPTSTALPPGLMVPSPPQI